MINQKIKKHYHNKQKHKDILKTMNIVYYLLNQQRIPCREYINILLLKKSLIKFRKTTV